MQQPRKIKNIFKEFDKRSGRWYWVVSRKWPDGTRFRKRNPNRELAKTLLDRINAAIVENRWEAIRTELRPARIQPVAAPVMTMRQLVTEFKAFALGNSLSDWGKIQGYLADGILDYFEPDTGITEISQREVEEFKMWRTDDDENEDAVRPCTANKDLSVLRAIFAKAIDWGYLSKGQNPAANVPNYPDDTATHQRYLRPEEYERLLAAARAQREVLLTASGTLWFPYLPEFIIFGVNNGPRFSETLSLPLASVDIPNRQFSIKNRPNKRTKNGTERHIGLNRESLEVVTILKDKAVNPNGMLFQLPDGSEWKEHRRIIRNQFAECVRITGLYSSDPMENVTIHTLRHTFASWMSEKGVQLRRLQALMGHTSITTTMRYMNLHPNERLDDTAVLDGIASGLTIAAEVATNWQQQEVGTNADCS